MIRYPPVIKYDIAMEHGNFRQLSVNRTKWAGQGFHGYVELPEGILVFFVG